jgi:hypothetical protein
LPLTLGPVLSLGPGVEAITGDVTDLSVFEDGTVDFAFASNIFEHLTQPQLASVLLTLSTKLAPNGTLTILKPNYRYAFREYFDDYTHISVWSHVSLADFLVANGFEIVELHPRFLPLTVKSRLPVWPIFIQAYLIYSGLFGSAHQTAGQANVSGRESKRECHLMNAATMRFVLVPQ